MMNVGRIDSVPRYLIRPSREDHKLLERLLLSARFGRSNPIDIDGIVLDAAYGDRLGQPLSKNPPKEALADRPVQIIVDPQSYRLVDGYSRVSSLRDLPYSPSRLFERDGELGYAPKDFADRDSVSRFVRSAFDYQKSLGASDYVTPAFFVGSEESPWIDVNKRILDESVSQAGTFLYAAVCGTLGGVTHEWTDSKKRASALAGVYVLVSPLAAQGDGVSKLLHYIDLLQTFRSFGLNVLAARQPAFGLVLMALGIAGFDSGIAQAERFNFPAMVRPPQKGKGRKHGGGQPRRVYIRQLLTPVQGHIAGQILAMRGLRGSFPCPEVCCKDNLTDAVLASREHFVWSRLSEVNEIRTLTAPSRLRHISERLATARQLAKKVRRTVPSLAVKFDHLDVWDKALEVSAAAKQVGGR